ncbi:hypothetical protein IFO70_03110 [Phormidium tenue FACHB-886]|nr:hypothetical protein [Phormidium tenue FACHB-886]
MQFLSSQPIAWDERVASRWRYRVQTLLYWKVERSLTSSHSFMTLGNGDRSRCYAPQNA